MPGSHRKQPGFWGFYSLLRWCDGVFPWVHQQPQFPWRVIPPYVDRRPWHFFRDFWGRRPWRRPKLNFRADFFDGKIQGFTTKDHHSQRQIRCEHHQVVLRGGFSGFSKSSCTSQVGHFPPNIRGQNEKNETTIWIKQNMFGWICGLGIIGFAYLNTRKKNKYHHTFIRKRWNPKFPVCQVAPPAGRIPFPSSPVTRIQGFSSTGCVQGIK